MVVDGKYAIELKIASAPSQLKSFLGQVLEYSREFEKGFLLICDSSGSIKPSNIRSLRRSLKDMNAENVAVMKKP